MTVVRKRFARVRPCVRFSTEHRGRVRVASGHTLPPAKFDRQIADSNRRARKALPKPTRFERPVGTHGSFQRGGAGNAVGTAGMDDRRNDGRGAWMASEGGGHEAKCEVRRVKFEREKCGSPSNVPTRMSKRSDARSRGFAQRTQRPQRRRAAKGKESERRSNADGS